MSTTSTDAACGDVPTPRSAEGKLADRVWRFVRAPIAAPGEGAGRAAAVVFGVLVAIAVPIIFWQGRDQWFFFDEWGLIAGRELGWDDLVRPHNEHLVAVPVVVYRSVFRLVGLDAYWPYQAVLVAAHVTTATLLRLVMRRAGVGPWIATAVAGALLLFGSGRQDIVWAFQISFTGAMALGLAQMLLADHEDPAPGRDVLAVAFGIAAVATSIVGVLMVATVALSLALRGRWRALAVQVVPPALVWGTWWLRYGRDAVGEAAGPRGAFDYATEGLGHALSGLGGSDLVGAALAVCVVAGLVLAVRRSSWRDVVGGAALPLALFAGGLAFLAVTGFARAGRTGNDVPEATRYVYLTAAFTLPLVAVAVQQLAQRARGLALIPIALLLVGVPGNADSLSAQGYEELTLGRKDVVLVGAHLPLLAQVPAARRPFGILEGSMTAGWLREAVADGKVPPAPAVSPEEEAAIIMEVALDARPGPLPGTVCPPLTAPTTVRLQRGDAIRFLAAPITLELVRSGAASAAVTFAADGNQRIEVVAGPLEVRVAPADGGTPSVCLPGAQDTAAPGQDFGEIETGYQGSGPRVAVLGDSITVASRDALGTALEGWALRVAALRGEGLSGGPISTASGGGAMPEQAEVLAGDQPEVAVVALGTNDAMLAELTPEAALAALDDIVASFDGACIVGVTVVEDAAVPGYSPDEAAAINARTAALADVVVPWAERAGADAERYLLADGIHPTAEGTELFAALVAEGVSACPQ